MKKFILGFISGVIVVVIVFLIFLFIRGSFNGSGPVNPESLNPNVKDYGSLRVEVFGKGNPLSNIEVDLGKVGSGGPTGPMSFTVTDSNGIASFDKVPIGKYDIFFNTNHFSNDYIPPQKTSVSIAKDQLTQKRIDLSPK